MYKGPEHYLDSDASTSRIMAHARLLQKLSRRFEAIAPSGLRHAARVANYKSGKIVIHADNGAVATKIRQMSQRLCDELSKGGAECSLMEVKVQPRQNLTKQRLQHQNPSLARLSGCLQATAENLPEGALRKALEHLVATRR
jgi:hypothetical protein